MMQILLLYTASQALPKSGLVWWPSDFAAKFDALSQVQDGI